MYYSKYENAWWFAGYQSELPGNMVYRESGMTLETTGIRYKPVNENVWKGPDLNERWQEIRNSVDWVAYTRRTGNYISLENFSSRVSNGEVFEYQSTIYDLATGDYKLVTLNSKTKIYFQTQLYDIGLVSYGYESKFHAPYHRLPDYGLATGILLNPDNSISIIGRKGEDVIQSSKSPYSHYIFLGVVPFSYENVNWLAASDTAIKEGVKNFDNSFSNILSSDEESAWFFRISDYDISKFHLLPTLGGELELSIVTPIVYPSIDNLHPRQ